MKYLLLVTCLALSGCAYAQEPVYTPMKGNYKFKGLKADTLLLIPSFNDTTSANATYLDQVAGAMIRCGNDFWMRNASTTAWLQNVNVGNGSSPAVNFVKKVYRKANRDSIFYIINPTDTQYAFTDRGFDTLRRSNDSVYAYRFGTKVFQFKDSGSAQLGDSPDRIDGKATNDVIADLDGNIFKFIRAKDFQIRDTSGIDGYFLIDMGGFQLNAADINITTTDTIRFNASSGNRKIIFDARNRIKVGDYNNTSELVGDLHYGKANKNIDLSLGNDTVFIPGTYVITNAGSSAKTLYLPTASDYPGQVIYIINTDAIDPAIIDAISSQIKYANSAAAGSVSTQAFGIATSDGDVWWYTENTP